MSEHDKNILTQKYKREFEVALIKICLASAGIGLVVGIILSASVMFLAG